MIEQREPPIDRKASKWVCNIVATALMLAFIVQTVLAIRTMSPTVDEPGYIATGYSYWKMRDARMNREHPPLIKLLIAIPLLPLDLKVPTDDPSWWNEDIDIFAKIFLYQDWANVDRMLFLARIPVVFLGVLLAVFVKRWAEELWGPVAGLGALFLFVFEPNILAHSSLATLDMGLTTFTFLSAYYLWKWLETRAPVHKAAASLMLGFALASKYSALALLPILFCQLLVHRYMKRSRNAPRRALTVDLLQILLGSVLVVVAVYALIFSWHAVLPPGSDHRTAKKVLARVPGLHSPGVQARIIAIGERIPIPALDNYLKGALIQRQHLARGQAAFFMGHYSSHGWWYYDLASFLMKTPIPILLVAAFRFLALPRLPATADEYFVMVPVIGIMALSFFNTLSIGLRYVLPIYPFLFVWLGRVIAMGVGRVFPVGDRTVPRSASG